MASKDVQVLILKFHGKEDMLQVELRVFIS